MTRADRSIALLTANVPRHTGVLSVGAYAARQRRKRIAIGTFGGLLAAAALWTYWALRPQGEIAGYRVAFECQSCHARQWATGRVGAALSDQCSNCKQPELRELVECGDCGTQFLRVPRETTLTCPACGSEKVGAPRQL